MIFPFKIWIGNDPVLYTKIILALDKKAIRESENIGITIDALKDHASLYVEKRGEGYRLMYARNDDVGKRAFDEEIHYTEYTPMEILGNEVNEYGDYW